MDTLPSIICAGDKVVKSVLMCQTWFEETIQRAKQNWWGETIKKSTTTSSDKGKARQKSNCSYVVQLQMSDRSLLQHI